MPARIKVKVIEARELPIMNSSSKKTDAYVEVNFFNYSEKTRVYESLNPVWNEEFVIEITKDRDILKGPLEFKVWDHDTFSSDNVIGSIFLDLNGLLHKKEHTIDGWFPIFDTFCGVQGQLHFQTSVEFFGIVVDSSLTVKFSHLSFANKELIDVFGFVDELLVSDELEQNKRDSLRSPRALNEFRQALFYKLSAKIKHRIGTKVRHLGGDAVLGYHQHFDHEPNGIIIVRGYGTAVKLKKKTDFFNDELLLDSVDTNSDDYEDHKERSKIDTNSPFDDHQQFFIQNEIDKKFSNIHNKIFSIFQSNDKGVQFLTLDSLPECCMIRLGGLVSVRSLKVISNGNRSEQKDTKLRDNWWGEVRQEIRAHASFLSCKFILGYTETCEIQDNVIILTAYGTAASIKFQHSSCCCFDGDHHHHHRRSLSSNQEKLPHNNIFFKENQFDFSNNFCSFFHVPFHSNRAPFDINLIPCFLCGRKFVPEILLATIDPLPYLKMEPGQLIEAHAVKFIKKSDGEARALKLAEVIPFIEYDLHRQIISKVKLLSLNSVFKLKTQISIGDNVVVGFVQATGFRLLALPTPYPFVVSKSILESNSLWNQVINLNTKNRKYIDSHFNTILKNNYKQSMESMEFPSTPTNNVLSSPPFYTSEIDSNTPVTPYNDGQEAFYNKNSTSFLVDDMDYKFDDEFLSILASEREINEDLGLFNTDYCCCDDSTVVEDYDQSLICLKVINFSSNNTSIVNNNLRNALQSIYSNIEFKLMSKIPYVIAGISTKLKILDNKDIFVLFQGIVKAKKSRSKTIINSNNINNQLNFSNTPEILISTLAYTSLAPFSPSNTSSCEFICSIHLFFIRECISIRNENKSPSEFIKLFIMEIRLIIRAHVVTLGGNALTNFNMDFIYDSEKNHLYCIANITGDIVLINKNIL